MGEVMVEVFASLLNKDGYPASDEGSVCPTCCLWRWLKMYIKAQGTRELNSDICQSNIGLASAVAESVLV